MVPRGARGGGHARGNRRVKPPSPSPAMPDTPEDAEDPAAAGPECQSQTRPQREPEDGSRAVTRGRALCSIRPPFWWYGGRNCPARPGGDPDDYEPRPHRVVRVPEAIPNLLQRLGVDSEGQYLPGQQQQRAGDSPPEVPDNVLPDDVDGGDEARSHEFCSCRKETWVRGGPLGPNRPDPSQGCRCACCRPRRPPRPSPTRAVAIPLETPVETWQARPPFWWWCHDKRSERPGGDPALYAPIFPVKQSQPGPPLAHRLEVDDPGFYIPGQVIFGFTPPIHQYWLDSTPEHCPDDYLTLSGLESRAGAGAPWEAMLPLGDPTPSCSRHGGLPMHPDALPSLLYSEMVGARAAPPQRNLRKPNPGFHRAEACDTCCNQSVQTMASVLPYGWRGWPGVKKAHMFYRDLHPCQRLAHCTRCKC